MKILINKDFKKLLLSFILALLIFIASGLYLVNIISDNYKQSMLEHDYSVAGYLLQKGFEPSRIAGAFTEDKTANELESGRNLLQASGYTTKTATYLFPEAHAFYKRSVLIFLVYSAFFSLLLLSVLLLFLYRQIKKIEKANKDIHSFMDGGIGTRLDDHEEGSLSQLFASVNGMATSLTTHIENEKHGREFLKETISDISHQLKTPLAALEMYMEIILNEKTGNVVVDEFTCKSLRELERKEILIKNLIKLVRLDEGSIILEKCRCNVKEFLKDVSGSFQTRAELEKKNIRLDCDENVVLSFDAEWLSEAIRNIIKNALDHTDTGSEIAVSCNETPVLTEINVQDNGSGIHPEDIHSIFKRFYRSRFSKDKQGIGIGLTLARAIVEKHGGSVTVESTLGKGTTFHLTFPKLSNL